MSDDRTLTQTDAGPVGDGNAWAWATEHGAPERASTEQLLGWLARGELPPYTLVWKPGWGEWLPAMQVAELAAAFPSVTPGSRRVAQAAWDPGAPPPPVPVEHYPRLRLLARDVVGHPKVLPVASAARGIEPAPAERRALRDPDYVQKDLVTSQVPVAAMLEAARAMKRVPASRAGELRGMPSVPSERPWRLDFGTFGDTFNALPASAGTPEAETGTIPLLRTLAPHAVELGRHTPVVPELGENVLRPSPRYGRWLSLGALAGAALGLIAVRGTATRKEAPAAPAAAASIAALKPEAARVVTGACRVASKPVRLDEHASRDIAPTLVSLDDGVKIALAPRDAEIGAGWVAIGYAQSHEAAAGVALSADSLEVQPLGVRRMTRRIFGVTPLVQDRELTIHADRDGSTVAYARTLDVDPPLRIGMNALGLVAGSLGAEPKRAWPLPAGSVISPPALAVHPGGLTVAALLGRKQGPLRVGVLGARGEPLSELGSIGDAAARFGRPALASGGGTTALAVAQRSRDGLRQSIWLSRAASGEPPLILQPFAPLSDEPVAPGADLDTPALAALPGGGFALLFTRGQSWQRSVQLQRLSSTLAPIGDAVDVTTPDRASRGASAGALHWVKDRLIAVHFLGMAAGSSLWATSIECELG